MTDEQPTPPIPERPLLRGQRVWLRPLEPRDMPAYVAGTNGTLRDTLLMAILREEWEARQGSG
ncbi:MAG: hypothetical protein ACXWMB_00920 [Candidatus Limnocylindria bacterium]